MFWSSFFYKKVCFLHFCSFNHVFYAVLGNRGLTHKVLATTLCLVEQKLNARPLVPASVDATDLDVLIINHFLHETSDSVLVWIFEPTSPRGNYPLARVVKLNFGTNGRQVC